jgi:ATP/ADP translocase
MGGFASAFAAIHQREGQNTILMTASICSSGNTPQSLIYSLLRRVAAIEPSEVAAVLWSWMCFFSVLSAHYILKPIRDEIGVAQVLTKIVWMFSGTLILLMIANPSFAALVARLTPVRFISTNLPAQPMRLYGAVLHSLHLPVSGAGDDRPEFNC